MLYTHKSCCLLPAHATAFIRYHHCNLMSRTFFIYLTIVCNCCKQPPLHMAIHLFFLWICKSPWSSELCHHIHDILCIFQIHISITGYRTLHVLKLIRKGIRIFSGCNSLCFACICVCNLCLSRSWILQHLYISIFT